MMYSLEYEMRQNEKDLGSMPQRRVLIMTQAEGDREQISTDQGGDDVIPMDAAHRAT